METEKYEVAIEVISELTEGLGKANIHKNTDHGLIMEWDMEHVRVKAELLLVDDSQSLIRMTFKDTGSHIGCQFCLTSDAIPDVRVFINTVQAHQ